MRNRVPPDKWSKIFLHATYRRTDFVKVCSSGNVDAMKSGNLFLPIYASDCRFDHQKLARAGISFELHSSHAYERNRIEESFCQRLKDRASFMCGGAARGHADIRRPNAEFAAGKRTDSRAVGSPVLQTEIQIIVRPLDPLLNDESWHNGQD